MALLQRREVRRPQRGRAPAATGGWAVRKELPTAPSSIAGRPVPAVLGAQGPSTERPRSPPAHRRAASTRASCAPSCSTKLRRVSPAPRPPPRAQDRAPRTGTTSVCPSTYNMSSRCLIFMFTVSAMHSRRAGPTLGLTRALCVACLWCWQLIPYVTPRG